MTEEERNEIDPEFCAEGLRYIAQRLYLILSYEEKCAMVGAICLIRDKNDGWCYENSDESWKQKLWAKRLNATEETDE